MTSRYQIGLWTSNVKETRVKPISVWLHVSATGLTWHQIRPWLFVFMITCRWVLVFYRDKLCSFNPRSIIFPSGLKRCTWFQSNNNEASTKYVITTNLNGCKHIVVIVNPHLKYNAFMTIIFCQEQIYKCFCPTQLTRVGVIASRWTFQSLIFEAYLINSVRASKV